MKNRSPSLKYTSDKYAMAYWGCPMLSVLDHDRVQDVFVDHAHLHDIPDDQNLVQEDPLGFEIGRYGVEN